MTVAELIVALQNQPQEAEVWLCQRVEMDGSPFTMLDVVESVTLDEHGDVVIKGERR